MSYNIQSDTNLTWHSGEEGCVRRHLCHSPYHFSNDQLQWFISYGHQTEKFKSKVTCPPFCYFTLQKKILIKQNVFVQDTFPHVISGFKNRCHQCHSRFIGSRVHHVVLTGRRKLKHRHWGVLQGCSVQMDFCKKWSTGSEVEIGGNGQRGDNKSLPPLH